MPDQCVSFFKSLAMDLFSRLGEQTNKLIK